MKTRVLLTGIGGFVGHHVMDHLLAKTDWDIVGIASWRHKGEPARVVGSRYYQENKDRVTLVTHDLTAPISERTKKKLGKVDYIINIASQSHVDRSIDDPVPFIRNNVDLELNILEYARQVKPKAFIQFSTDEVYGPAHGDYLSKEWDPILPSNPYSASKACQEAIAIAYWRTYGVPVIITNTMNVLGERQDKEKYLPIIIGKLLRGEKVTVHGEEGDISSRFYIHARNVADCMLFILATLPASKYPEAIAPDRYNIVGEKEMDNLELAQLVADIMDKTLEYELVEVHKQRPGHDKRYALDGEKLGLLGWNPPKNLRESLEKTISWSIKNKEWL